MRPLISICIANFNGIEIIDVCIRSVQDQVGGLSTEIIVHDNGSSDGSAAHIKARHPAVRLSESPDNLGFCIANNRMAEMARGQFLLLLNNDATLRPDALATLYGAAQDLGQPAILGLPQYEFGTGKLLDIGSFLDPFLNAIPNKMRGNRDLGMVVGACLWIPRSLWVQLGGFPEWFGSIAEDLYLCCRARLAGYPVRALDRSGFDHRVGFSFGGGKVTQGKLATNRRRRALSERNKTFVMIICQPALLAAGLVPVHLVLLGLEGLLLSLLKRDRELWREIYAPLLPSLWRARRELCNLRRVVQSHRKLSWRRWLEPFRWTYWKIEMLRRHGIPEVGGS